MAERLHAIVKANAPALSPRTWYGMPVYAKNGNVVCFFQSAHKFKARYATFGFSDKANLDEGTMWPVRFRAEGVDRRRRGEDWRPREESGELMLPTFLGGRQRQHRRCSGTVTESFIDCSIDPRQHAHNHRREDNQRIENYAPRADQTSRTSKLCNALSRKSAIRPCVGHAADRPVHRFRAGFGTRGRASRGEVARARWE